LKTKCGSGGRLRGGKYRRLTAVRAEDEATEAIGALRELLELEDLLVPPNLPLSTQTP
jgi:hypothetical protein